EINEKISTGEIDVRFISPELENRLLAGQITAEELEKEVAKNAVRQSDASEERKQQVMMQIDLGLIEPSRVRHAEVSCTDGQCTDRCRQGRIYYHCDCPANQVCCVT
ncbi:hypothetical protein KY360_02940, partial [Candidatus Woesearchaeota archaeon]|nr:hypothetical protein [Candidatus Woesearchaeota archaeon]